MSKERAYPLRKKRTVEVLKNDQEKGSVSLIRILVDTSSRPRLDLFLNSQLPWRSRTQLKELVEEGCVRVDGRTCKPSYRVRKGETVEVLVPSKPMPALQFEPGRIPVLYEDDTLVVLNKPPGILSHPTSGHQFDTLVNYVEVTFGEKGKKHYICHRLDRETSGAILIAFDPRVRKLLQEQFEKHMVDKEYLALVAGSFPERLKKIDIPIAKGDNLRTALEGPDRKSSLTLVECLARNEKASCVKAKPITGRQNQIRIHLAAVGFPLIGDTRFGGPPPPHNFSRFFLHARLIRFYHPVQKLVAEIKAPLPEDFIEALESLNLRVPDLIL